MISQIQNKEFIWFAGVRYRERLLRERLGSSKKVFVQLMESNIHRQKERYADGG